MKEYNLKDRFKYWMDQQMSKGTSSIIRLLTIAVLFVVIFVTVMIVIFNLRDSVFSAFWDSLATIINAWMPSSDDGEVGYIILNTITAIVGLLFTSILIGVISSGIEEKLSALRKGNTVVLEKDHTVILGYNLGEHGLLKQLILSTGNRKRVIVICTDYEKPDMEDDLNNNVDIPKNIKVICRNGDITSINDLRICSIEKAKLLIINALDDNRRIKAILAVSALKKEYPECEARIVACVTDEKHMLPRNKTSKNNIILMKTDDIMAKIIAHTATEPGLSIPFKELLNFENNEIYFEKIDELTGRSVMEIAASLDKAILTGIRRDGKITMNPAKDLTILEGDDLILFEPYKGAYQVRDIDLKDVRKMKIYKARKRRKGKVLIFNCNVLLDMILNELPDDVKDVVIVSEDKEAINRIRKEFPRFNVTSFKSYENRLNALAKEAGHIVLLSDREMDKEDADIDNILLLLKLLDIRETKNYKYNITVELNLENSYNVAVKNDIIDYIVGSNVASLVLAQLAENPDFEGVLEELLSHKGNEIYSKSADVFNLEFDHDYAFGTLKQILLSYKYTLLGLYLDGEVTMNPPIDTRVVLDEDDRLFVLGED